MRCIDCRACFDVQDDMCRCGVDEGATYYAFGEWEFISGSKDGGACLRVGDMAKAFPGRYGWHPPELREVEHDA